MSDNVDADPQQTLEAAAVKLNQIRESMKPKADEVFAVQLTIHEEYNDTGSHIVSVNRSIDGALQAAIEELIDYGALDTEELGWSEEEVEVLGGQEELYAFVHHAKLSRDRIYYYREQLEAVDCQYELDITKLVIGT